MQTIRVAAERALSHLPTLVSGAPMRRPCPQLVIAAIAVQHGRVAMGQVRNMTNADGQLRRAF